MSLDLVFLTSPRHRPLCVGAGAGPSLALLAQAVCSEAGFQTFSDYSLVPVGEVFFVATFLSLSSNFRLGKRGIM